MHLQRVTDITHTNAYIGPTNILHYSVYVCHLLNHLQSAVVLMVPHYYQTQFWAQRGAALLIIHTYKKEITRQPHFCLVQRSNYKFNYYTSSLSVCALFILTSVYMLLRVLFVRHNQAFLVCKHPYYMNIDPLVLFYQRQFKLL